MTVRRVSFFRCAQDLSEWQSTACVLCRHPQAHTLSLRELLMNDRAAAAPGTKLRASGVGAMSKAAVAAGCVLTQPTT
jgi:hypothetical protein